MIFSWLPVFNCDSWRLGGLPSRTEYVATVQRGLSPPCPNDLFLKFRDTIKVLQMSVSQNAWRTSHFMIRRRRRWSNINRTKNETSLKHWNHYNNNNNNNVSGHVRDKADVKCIMLGKRHHGDVIWVISLTQLRSVLSLSMIFLGTQTKFYFATLWL